MLNLGHQKMIFFLLANVIDIKKAIQLFYSLARESVYPIIWWTW